METLIYQTKVMPKDQQMLRLGGAIALLKAQSTQVFEFCAREAAQIFGGLAYTRGGQGERVERLYREVRAYAIPGGSEVNLKMKHLRMRRCRKSCLTWVCASPSRLAK